MDIDIMDTIEIVLFMIVLVLASLHFWMKRRNRREKNIEQSVEFEELKPGSYLFMTTPVQHINCSLTGECGLYFTLLECNGKTVPVVVDISAKIEIQDAMRGKFINQIESGEGLEIDKNHNITKIET